MLAHVGDLAADPLAEVRHGQLAKGERFEDTQALGVRQRPPDRGVSQSFGFGRDRKAIQHPKTVSSLAQIRKCCGGPLFHELDPRRPNPRGILARMPAGPEHIVTIDEIEAARDRITGRVHRTELLSSATAARWLTAASGVRIHDDRLFLKPEHLQKTGSFKARGMVNKIATLSADAKAGGAITLSAGNAGQACAWAGRMAGVAVTVVMPEGAVRSKVEACLGYGARVVLHGAHVGDAFAEMERIRDAEGLEFVHPFDDPAVIAGHGSIGLELIEDLPDVDVLVVGVGGGGLIAGVAAAVKERRPSVRVYGVEPERSNAMSLALAANEVVRIQPESVADGLGAPFAGAWTLAMCRRYLDGIVLLDDPTILAGMRFGLERLKQVLEPAGAAALAAVLAGRIPIHDDERVAVVLSGGNVEVSRLGALLEAAGGLPGAGS
jgi:threonine dehydratase